MGKSREHWPGAFPVPLRSGRVTGMESTRDQRARAIGHRIYAMAEKLVERTKKKIRADGILEAPHIVDVFVIACATSIVELNKDNPALASEFAASALRTIIKNMKTNGVTIPDLNMEGWTPPNIHWGTDSHH